MDFQIPADKMRIYAYNYDALNAHKHAAGVGGQEKYVPAFNFKEAAKALSYYATNAQFLAFGAWHYVNLLNWYIFWTEIKGSTASWNNQRLMRYNILLLDFHLVGMGFMWAGLSYASQFKPAELSNPVLSGVAH